MGDPELNIDTLEARVAVLESILRITCPQYFDNEDIPHAVATAQPTGEIDDGDSETVSSAGEGPGETESEASEEEKASEEETQEDAETQEEVAAKE